MDWNTQHTHTQRVRCETKKGIKFKCYRHENNIKIVESVQCLFILWIKPTKIFIIVHCDTVLYCCICFNCYMSMGKDFFLQTNKMLKTNKNFATK